MKRSSKQLKVSSRFLKIKSVHSNKDIYVHSAPELARGKKHCQKTLISEILTDSPTWIHEMLAHLKRCYEPIFIHIYGMRCDFKRHLLTHRVTRSPIELSWIAKTGFLNVYEMDFTLGQKYHSQALL